MPACHRLVAVRGRSLQRPPVILLKHVVFNHIHATRFKPLFSRMSLSNSRFPLLGDKH